MKDYKKNMLLALGCFLVIVVLNFFLPRLLPGDPVAYLTGFAEEDMTPAQIDYYRQALHLDKPLIVQFGYYLRSLADGTLGYSYKKSAAVALLIRERLGYTLQITVPAVLLSAALGLSWGLVCGYRKNSIGDRLSTGALIVLNAVPTFVIGRTGICSCGTWPRRRPTKSTFSTRSSAAFPARRSVGRICCGTSRSRS